MLGAGARRARKPRTGLSKERDTPVLRSQSPEAAPGGAAGSSSREGLDVPAARAPRVGGLKDGGKNLVKSLGFFFSFLFL